MSLYMPVSPGIILLSSVRHCRREKVAIEEAKRCSIRILTNSILWVRLAVTRPCVLATIGENP